MPLLLGTRITKQTQASLTQSNRRTPSIESHPPSQASENSVLTPPHPPARCFHIEEREPHPPISQGHPSRDSTLSLKRGSSRCVTTTHRSIAIRPAKHQRMLISSSTQHVAINRLSDLSAVASNTSFVDVIAVHPRNAIVFLRDEAINARNQETMHARNRRSHCARHPSPPIETDWRLPQKFVNSPSRKYFANPSFHSRESCPNLAW